MSSIQMLNPNADVARRAQALQITINAAQGLQNVIKTNLGPKGTLKMYHLKHYVSSDLILSLGSSAVLATLSLPKMARSF
jgi:hypothetical protein